jgi:hypothetical protein
MRRDKPATAAAPSIVRFRKAAAKGIPPGIGVYALCDLDAVPIYVGKSEDGIRARVNRHITSARSDVIANRMVDVWEIASVMCWPVKQLDQLRALESFLYHKFHPRSRLMNGTVPRRITRLPFSLPAQLHVRLMPDEEVVSRRRIELRLPRQAKHFMDLLDHYLNVKDSKDLHLALQAHFQRLTNYFHRLRPTSPD